MTNHAPESDPRKHSRYCACEECLDFRAAFRHVTWLLADRLERAEPADSAVQRRATTLLQLAAPFLAEQPRAGERARAHADPEAELVAS